MPRWQSRWSPLEQRLHVPDVVEEVGQDDDVERRRRRREVVRVGLDEVQLADGAARAPLDHRRREVDADAHRRAQRGQQIAVAAAELEDAQPRRHEEAVDLLEPAVVGARARRRSPRAWRATASQWRDAASPDRRRRPTRSARGVSGGMQERRREGRRLGPSHPQRAEVRARAQRCALAEPLVGRREARVAARCGAATPGVQPAHVEQLARRAVRLRRVERDRRRRARRCRGCISASSRIERSSPVPTLMCSSPS